MLLLTGCVLNRSCCPPGKRKENSPTIFFILGFLDEYLGRRIEKKGDFVEHFYCNEQGKALLFEKYLYKLKTERKINTVIRKELEPCETQDEAHTYFYSLELKKLINSYYKFQFRRQGFCQNDKIRYRKIAEAFVRKDVFKNNQMWKLAYLAGAYSRYGYGESFVFANADHKVILIIDLLNDLGCLLVTHITSPTIPRIHRIYFQPTEEIREWLTRPRLGVCEVVLSYQNRGRATRAQGKRRLRKITRGVYWHPDGHTRYEYSGPGAFL
jgi:hypothetical protein